jgi:hypothetical protein
MHVSLLERASLSVIYRRLTLSVNPRYFDRSMGPCKQLPSPKSFSFSTIMLLFISAEAGLINPAVHPSNVCVYDLCNMV